ncbi:hypothetical protein GCM10010276_65040 [Streptomyces longisporus]|uniref:Uncharacterized protein n=1 Tax=Streptomyces longisporus TaxID=1948 RepID=A0ABP6A353_STRLO
MSRPPEYEYGAPQGPPNVYHPQPEPAPSYEEYADPAVAHGWLNAYDSTREMPVPPAVDETYVPRPSRRKPKRASGRRGNGRRASAGRWGLVAQFPAPLKGALVAGGVVGALMVGFSLAGSPTAPPSGVQGKEESAAPAVGGSASPTASEVPAGSSTGRPSGGGAESSQAAYPGPSAPTRTASERVTHEPSAGTSTAGATAVPTPTVTASGPGRSGSNPGHGQGGSKGPK